MEWPAAVAVAAEAAMPAQEIAVLAREVAEVLGEWGKTVVRWEAEGAGGVVLGNVLQAA